MAATAPCGHFVASDHRGKPLTPAFFAADWADSSGSVRGGGRRVARAKPRPVQIHDLCVLPTDMRGGFDGFFRHLWED